MLVKSANHLQMHLNVRKVNLDGELKQVGQHGTISSHDIHGYYDECCSNSRNNIPIDYEAVGQQ